MRAALIIAVLTLAAGIAAFVAGRQARQPEVSVRQPAVANVIGQPLTSFQATDLDGGQRSIRDWDGQVMLINFWATWCAPCRREMPDLMALQEQMEGQAVVIGVALDFPEEVERFVAELGIDYPVLVADDLSGTRIVRDLGNANGLLPYSVFVDRKGVIRHVKLGELTPEEAREHLQRLL